MWFVWFCVIVSMKTLHCKITRQIVNTSWLIEKQSNDAHHPHTSYSAVTIVLNKCKTNWLINFSHSANWPINTKWRLSAGRLVAVTVVELNQSNQRWDGAHQPHQPGGESSCPQEAMWHPVDGVTEVGHTAEDRQQLGLHLSAELRGTAGGSDFRIWSRLLTNKL